MLVTCLGFALFMWFPGALNAPSNTQSCFAPRLNDGFFVPKRKIYPNGSQLTYACHEGHKPAVKGWWEQITCQDGTWSHEPQCINETACLSLHIPNGQYSENAQGWYDEGDIISVTCNEGYEPIDMITFASCIDGKWTDEPVCQKITQKCTEPPKIPHAVIIDLGYQDEFLPNATVHYKCEHGYSLEGGEARKTAICTFGRWSDTPNCIFNPGSTKEDDSTLFTSTSRCGNKPTINHGHLVEINAFFLKYECSTNFTLEGSDIVVCNSNGFWSKLPTCSGSSTSGGVGEDTGPYISIAKCGTPPRIDNGDVVEKTLKYLKYQCSAFYTLQGSDTVVCHSDGTWSKPPTCLGNFCTVDTATYRLLEDTGTHFVKSGDQQEFQCIDSPYTSYGYCQNGYITFERCCSAWQRYLNRCD